MTFEETVKILANFHEGPTRGHFYINIIVRKVLTFGYWWPTLNKYVVDMCQTCDICQQLTPMWQSSKGPLQPVMAFESFMKWGLNFMGPIKLVVKFTRN